MDELIEKANKEGLISFVGEEKNQLYYKKLGHTVSFLEEKEQVRLKVYLELYFKYHFPLTQISLNYPPTSSKMEDLVVYKEQERCTPYIMVVCRNSQISESEFQQVVTNSCYRALELSDNEMFVIVTNGIKMECWYCAKNRKYQIPDIPSFGKTKVPHYRYVKGGGKNGIVGNDIATIDNASLTSLFKQAHNSLWAGGQLNPSEAFDELDKLIFCKIWDERQERKEGEPYAFQVINEDGLTDEDVNNRRLKENAALFNRVNKLYEEGRKKDPAVFRDSIRLSSEKIRTVVSYLEGVNLSMTDLDSKGHAFETFMDSFFRGNFGQYFTPRNIVSFIVSVLPITNTSKVMDTSCGSGGFLLYALDKVRKQASDIYPDYRKSKQSKEKWYKHWHDFASNNLFGIEISEQISRAAKMNMIIHDDGHTNVVTSDGLVKDTDIQEEYGNLGFKYGTFDFIITNPPFGSRISARESEYLKNYYFGCKLYDWLDGPNCMKFNDVAKIREAQSSEVLFLEQDYKYLKEGGILAAVIPDGILSNSSLLYVRDQLSIWYQVLAIVSLPQYTFASTGAGVKSSILFLKKKTKEEVIRAESIVSCIKEDLLKHYGFAKAYKELQRAKNQEIKTVLSESKFDTSIDEVNKIKAEINLVYNEKISKLKSKLQDAYKEEYMKKMPNYKVFMALIENVGYDSTGRTSPVNNLKDIEGLLTDFIKKNL